MLTFNSFNVWSLLLKPGKSGCQIRITFCQCLFAFQYRLFFTRAAAAGPGGCGGPSGDSDGVTVSA